MSAFENWANFAVHQRRRRTGCIPTGYGMILRAANVKGIDYATFQDEFDLKANPAAGHLNRKNDFRGVAAAVTLKYDFVEFGHRTFGSGAEKIALIDDMILKKLPVLLSLSNDVFGGDADKYHILPIFDSTTEQYLLLRYVDEHGVSDTRWIGKTRIETAHDKYAGGKDVAFLIRGGQENEEAI